MTVGQHRYRSQIGNAQDLLEICGSPDLLIETVAGEREDQADDETSRAARWPRW